MARKPIVSEDVLNPHRILTNLCDDYINNNLEGGTFLYRALVVKIDYSGGELQKQPPNPKNSIRAKVITEGIDCYTSEENLGIFWPLFSHDTMSVKEGEHVYVIFEDEERMHGIWLCRCPEPNNVDNINYVPGNKKYEENPDKVETGLSLDKKIQYVTDDSFLVKPQISSNFAIEKIPSFLARVGDRVLEGSNNTTIILGRDRKDSVSSGEKNLAGTIDIVAGRKDKDINLSEDQSRIYITMKSDVDNNFNINAGQKSPSGPFIVEKSDYIRIIGRKNIKLVVEGGDVDIKANGSGKITIDGAGDVRIKSSSKTIIDSPTINVGSDTSSQPLVLGNLLISALAELATIISTGPIAQIVEPLPGELAITNPAISTSLGAWAAKLSTLLSLKHKTE